MGDLTSTLHMGSAEPAVPPLPSTSQDSLTTQMQLGCTTEDVYEVADDQPPYPLPAVQVMPTQEPGTARRLPTQMT